MAGLGLIGFVLYALGMTWPYFEAVIVRDAAVTSWISIVPAPIGGYTTRPLYPGSHVGSDGRLATIADPRADKRDLAHARAEMTRAASRAAAQTEFLEALVHTAGSRSQAEARLRLVQAESSLKELRAEEVAAREVLAAAELAYQKALSLDITAPPGAIVWNLYSGPNAPVAAGAPVVSWIDCRVVLVDVPLSDVAASLLRIGSRADVVIEGERKARKGKVILTRGSAGVLGTDDLAALAKGRRKGLAQVIVQVPGEAADEERCPVGLAAYVDFPELGIFRIVRARLRL